VLYNVREVHAHKVDATVVQLLHELGLEIIPGERTRDVGRGRTLVASQDTVLNLFKSEVEATDGVEEGLARWCHHKGLESLEVGGSPCLLTQALRCSLKEVVNVHALVNIEKEGYPLSYREIV